MEERATGREWCETRHRLPRGFAALPSRCLALGTDLVVADANAAFYAVTGRTWDELVGQYLFDTFPQQSRQPGSRGGWQR
ncbi:PAS domain-containing protein [Streptomyces sp. NPDC003720]|uniref:PAS domain-containing protein n=1 Tax=Streptomyces sp. NPDC003720 TaxID=3364684 RepID=UPI00367F5311